MIATIISLILIALMVAFIVVFIVGSWKMYRKAGEHGFAFLIPFYGSYVYYRMTFGIGWLFLVPTLLFSAASFLLNMAETGLAIGTTDALMAALFCAILSLILVAVCLIITLVSDYKLAKAFGHGFGYFLGIVFLPYIFIPILGFGRSAFIPAALRKARKHMPAVPGQ